MCIRDSFLVGHIDQLAKLGAFSNHFMSDQIPTHSVNRTVALQLEISLGSHLLARRESFARASGMHHCARLADMLQRITAWIMRGFMPEAAREQKQCAFRL
eukprot:8556757-Pyramimonas_sp.AAC.1